MPKYKYVSTFIDRHGKTRHQFRRLGFARYYFQSILGSISFEIEYHKCLTGVDPKTLKAETLRAVKAQEKRVMENVVYFIGTGDGPIKIGFSNNALARLSKLQIGHPRRLRILAKMPGTKELEAHLHNKFAYARIRGEWFKCDPEIKELISQNKAA